MDNWFILDNARKWLKAIEIQGERILTKSRELFKESGPQSMKGGREDWRSKQLAIQIDEHFFVISVNKANQWLTNSFNENLISKELLEDFQQVTNF